MHANVKTITMPPNEYTLGILKPVRDKHVQTDMWESTSSLAVHVPKDFLLMYKGSCNNGDLFEQLPYVVVKMMGAKSRTTMEVAPLALALQKFATDYVQYAEYEPMSLEGIKPEQLVGLVSSGVVGEFELELRLLKMVEVLDAINLLEDRMILYTKWSPKPGSAGTKEAAYMIFRKKSEDYEHFFPLHLGNGYLDYIRDFMGD